MIFVSVFEDGQTLFLTPESGKVCFDFESPVAGSFKN